MSENSIEFSLSNSEQRDSWLNSGHRTLDTDNFQLVHKPGNSQKKVDALSRRPDYSQGKDDNEDQIVLKGEWFRNLTIQEGEFWKEVEEAEKFMEEEV